MFRTSDLKLQRALKTSVDDINELEASRDGKYLYALDSQAGDLGVIDTNTGREVNILKSVGAYPLLVMPLPDEAPGTAEQHR